jgi:hypothetical protein
MGMALDRRQSRQAFSFPETPVTKMTRHGIQAPAAP